MNHLLSVIIPVYNVESYLERCLDSIINQTYKNLEIILVNDGSTDKSESICNYYAKKDNRIIVINQENGGSSIARNTGLKNCNGEFIGFVDSDDWLKLNMFYILYPGFILTQPSKQNQNLQEARIISIFSLL